MAANWTSLTNILVGTEAPALRSMRVHVKDWWRKLQPFPHRLTELEFTMTSWSMLNHLRPLASLETSKLNGFSSIGDLYDFIHYTPNFTLTMERLHNLSLDDLYIVPAADLLTRLRLPRIETIKIRGHVFPECFNPNALTLRESISSHDFVTHGYARDGSRMKRLRLRLRSYL